MPEQNYTQFTTTVPGEHTSAEEARMCEAFSAVGKLITPGAVTEINHLSPHEADTADKWQLLGQNIAELLLERTDLVDTRISRKLGAGLARYKITTVGQVLALSSEQTLVIPHLSSQAAKSRLELPRVMAALRKESRGVIPPMLVRPEPSDVALVCRTLSDVPTLTLFESPRSWDRDIVDNFSGMHELAALSAEDIFYRINHITDVRHVEHYRTRAHEIKNRAAAFISEFLTAKAKQPQD